jgi:hypothetical protein
MVSVSAPAKVNYLNNRELLQEIHNSKKSFCSFIDPAHAEFDIIVHDIADVNLDTIDIVREKRSTSRGKLMSPITDIPIESVVVRVMTYEHIPVETVPSKRRSAGAGYERTTFPPFKHYILTEDGPQEVCRSHWIGGFDNGAFCADHGRINNKLARMFSLLVDRYAKRGNWRSYSYNDEFRGQALVQLCQVALQFDEAKSLNPFAYYTTTIKMCFTKVLNLEKRVQNIRDDLLTMAGATPSYTRQADNEAEFRFPSAAPKQVIKRKAGAPRKDAPLD